MNRNSVVVVGILGVVVLMIVGLLTGHDGAILSSAFTVVGALVGFTFGRLGDPPASPTKKTLPLLPLLLLVPALALLASCSGVPVAVEACIIDPEYGRVCVTYVKGQPITIKADVELPPEARARIEDAVRKLARQ